MSIITRSGKGQPLTHTELDGNFQYIQDHRNLEYLLDETSHPQYSLTSHTHAYLSVTGGTINGDITLTGDDPVIRLAGPANTLPGPSIEWQEADVPFGENYSNGFRWIYDSDANDFNLEVCNNPSGTAATTATVITINRSHWSMGFNGDYDPNYGAYFHRDTKIDGELLADRVYIRSEEDATEYPFEISTWAQTGLPYEISMVLHNYSDSQGFRIDQIGSGSHITLNNTFNEQRRPGVTGSGDFIKCYQTNDSTQQLWGLASNSNMIWYGDTNETAKLIQNKSYDGSFGFSIQCNQDNQYHTEFKNAGRQLFYIKESDNNDIVDLFAGESMTSGLRVNAVSGNIELIPKEDLLLSPTSGNVGVGTSTPRNTFHVSGDSNQNGFVSLLNFSIPTHTWNNFKLKTGIPWNTSITSFDTFMSKLIIDGWYYHGSIKIELGWYIYENKWYSPSVQCLNAKDRLCPTVSGAVEDGYIVFYFDQSPVSHYGTFQLSMIEGRDTETYDYARFDFVNEAPSGTAEKVELIPYKGWNQNNTLYINDGLSAKVGIGTNNPLYNLHVAGTGVTRFLVQSTNDEQASFDLLGGGHHIRWITDSTYATRLYKQYSPYGDLMWIKYDGTTQFNSPTFTVTGNVVVQNSISANTKQVQVANGGAGAARPESPVDYEMFFDTNIGKPIWYNGFNWVDATGATA